MEQKHYWILAIGLMIIGFVWVILTWTDVIDFLFADWIGWIVIAIGVYFGNIANSIENSKVSLFQLLVLVACADGNLSDTESRQIGEYAKQFDISGKRLEAIVKQVTEGKVQFMIPETTEEREKNIKALVKMANADGKIDANELQLIKNVAEKYGINESFVDKLV
jgi:uncharacterized tellurite resistance protein B-like protein